MVDLGNNVGGGQAMYGTAIVGTKVVHLLELQAITSHINDFPNSSSQLTPGWVKFTFGAPPSLPPLNLPIHMHTCLHMCSHECMHT